MIICITDRTVNANAASASWIARRLNGGSLVNASGQRSHAMTSPSTIEAVLDEEIETHEEAINAIREQKLLEIRERIDEEWEARNEGI